MKLAKKLKSLYPITDKMKNLVDFTNSILNRTMGMFEYTGLPDSLPAVEIEKRLQLNGYCTIFQYQGKLYVTTGGLSGQEKSPYNQPTKVIVSVPALNINQTLDINKNCVLIKNDDLALGLLTTIRKHGTQLIENEITMLDNDFNSRIQTTFSGGTDQTIQSAKDYLNTIINGDLGVVAENSFLQDLKVQNNQGQAKITFDDLIAYQQYLVSDLYNELGISSLNQMKKERMTTDEINANNDNMFTLVDNMYRNRKTGFDMVNKLFNGNIAVDYSGNWKDHADQRNTPEQSNDGKTVGNQVDQPTEPTQLTQPTQTVATNNNQEQNTQPSQPNQDKQQTQPTDNKDKKEDK